MGLDTCRQRLTRRVGVEIEGVGADARHVARIAEARGWKQVEDGSLDDDRPVHQYATCVPTRTFEAVSPPLAPNRRDTAPRMLRQLRRVGMRVNDSCGLHVHIDAKDLGTHALLHLLGAWYHHETAFTLMLGQRLERTSVYSRAFEPCMMARFAAQRPSSRRQLLEAWRKSCLELRTLADEPYGELSKLEVQRYWNLNYHALANRHGTVEFRAFEATTEPRRLEAYIALADALVSQAAAAGQFTDWSIFTRPRHCPPIDTMMHELGIRGWIRQHFATMDALAGWAYTEATQVPADIAELLDAPYCAFGSILENAPLNAAHRTAEACLTGAKHLDLSGLSLTSLPPGIRESRTLKSVDLRFNLFAQPPQTPRRLRLDLRHNTELLTRARELQSWAQARAQVAQPNEKPMQAAQRVYTCLAQQQDELTLSGLGPPPFFQHLVHVRHLKVEDSYDLPPWVQQLPRLEKLTLRCGGLQVLPRWLGKMRNLGHLNIEGNIREVKFTPALRRAASFWRITGPVTYGCVNDENAFADQGDFANFLSMPPPWRKAWAYRKAL